MPQERKWATALVGCLSGRWHLKFVREIQLILSSSPAEVHGEGGAGDYGGGVGAEVGGEVGDFGGLDEALHGGGGEHDVFDHLVGRHLVGLGLVGDLVVDEGGADVGGADEVGGDAVLAALQGRGAGEAEEAVLGGDVAGLEGRGDEGVDGADVDDAAPFLLFHRRPAVAGEEERGGEHEGEHALPLVLGKFLDRRYVLVAGVVDEDVDGAVQAQGFIDELAAAVAAREVGGDEVAAEAPGVLDAGLLVEIRDHDGAAVACEALGTGEADAARGTCDERNLLHVSGMSTSFANGVRARRRSNQASMFGRLGRSIGTRMKRCTSQPTGMSPMVKLSPVT